MKKERKDKTIVIIGGGAAGFFAAIRAAELNINSKVYILEATNKVLSKVLISGGGRCNVTNNTKDNQLLSKKYPRGGKELRSAFSQFSVNDTIEWFEKRGVELKTESDSRMFPISDNSETIANALCESAKNAKVKLKLNSKVKNIKLSEKNNFLIELKDEKIIADKVILATGGNKNAYNLAEELGHNIIKPVPSLFTFEIKSPFLDNLSGLSFNNVIISLKTPSKTIRNEGPLLITHWGLSGPAVIVLSSVAARELYEIDYKAEISINFLTKFKFDELMDTLITEKQNSLRKKVSNYRIQELPNAFWLRVLEVLNIDSQISWAELSNKSIRLIAETLIKCPFQVVGKGKFKEEFVTAGGVDLKQINFKTMESKLIPGFYFAGEILDIDGVTGGFNFQAAWTTAFIAGSNI